MTFNLFCGSRHRSQDSTDSDSPSPTPSAPDHQRRRLQRRPSQARELTRLQSQNDGSTKDSGPVVMATEERDALGQQRAERRVGRKMSRFRLFGRKDTDGTTTPPSLDRPHISEPIEVLQPSIATAYNLPSAAAAAAAAADAAAAAEVVVDPRKLGRQEEALGSHPPWEDHLPHELDAPTLTANPKRWAGLFSLDQILAAGSPTRGRSVLEMGDASEEAETNAAEPVSEPLPTTGCDRILTPCEGEERPECGTSGPRIVVSTCDPEPAELLGVDHAWHRRYLRERRAHEGLRRRHAALEARLGHLWATVRPHAAEEGDLELPWPEKLEVAVHRLVRERIVAQIQLGDLRGFVRFYEEQAARERRKLEAAREEVRRLRG